MSGTWATGWADGDIVSAAEYAKSAGCIYDTTLGSAAASIDVTGIVGVYAHLLIIGYLRSDSAAQGVDIRVRFNGDSGANYGAVGAGIDGGSASGSVSITLTAIGASGSTPVPAASATAGGFGALSMFIPHYAGAANHKSCTMQVGNPSATTTGGTSSTSLNGVWRNTAAINRVTVSLSAGNVVAGSRLSIYAMGS